MYPMPEISPDPSTSLARVSLEQLYEHFDSITSAAMEDGFVKNFEDIVDRFCDVKRRFLAALLEPGQMVIHPLGPHEIVANLIAYCRFMTYTSRLFLETQRARRLPNDYLKYPGKLDHTTVVCFRPATQPSQLFHVSVTQPANNRWSLTVRTAQPGELHLIRRSSHRVLLSLVEERPEPEEPTTVPVLLGLTIQQLVSLPFEVPQTQPTIARYSNTTTVFTWSPQTRFDEDLTYLDLPKPAARRRHSSRSRKSAVELKSTLSTSPNKTGAGHLVTSKSSEGIKDRIL